MNSKQNTDKRISEKTKQKRREVLAHALECFTQHGLEGTTIEMIRDASGMSVGSLYHHFGNKEKIASALFREGMRGYAKVVKRYAVELFDKKGGPTLEDGIKALVFANVDWISDNPDWARFVFHHRSAVTRSGDEEVFRDDYSEFAKMLAVWAKQMGVEDVESLDMALVSSMINGPTHNYARQWLAGRVKTPLIEYRNVFAGAAWASVQSVLIKRSSTS